MRNVQEGTRVYVPGFDAYGRVRENYRRVCLVRFEIAGWSAFLWEDDLFPSASHALKCPTIRHVLTFDFCGCEQPE